MCALGADLTGFGFFEFRLRSSDASLLSAEVYVFVGYLLIVQVSLSNFYVGVVTQKMGYLLARFSLSGRE